MKLIYGSISNFKIQRHREKYIYSEKFNFWEVNNLPDIFINSISGVSVENAIKFVTIKFRWQTENFQNIL